MLDDPLGMVLAQLRKAGGFQTADVTRVVMVHLVVFLVAGNPDFFRVDDDDVVTGINVRQSRFTDSGLALKVFILIPDKLPFEGVDFNHKGREY
jgi:hypothetical protein